MGKKKFSELFLAFLDIGITKDTSPEQQRVINGANIFQLLAILGGVSLFAEFFIFGIYDFLVMGIIGLAGAASCLTYAHYFKYKAWPTIMMAMAYSLFFLYRAASTALPIPLFLWTFLMPFVYLLAMGGANGFVAIAAHSMALLVITLWPDNPFYLNDFAPAERAQVLLLYALGLVVASGSQLVTRLSDSKASSLVNILHEKSQIDELTGLYNRRAFRMRLDLEMQRALRSGKPFCLVMCDIDFFKTVNDNYGHICGDHALKHLAGLLSRRCRRTDTVTRWGGEEFILLLPETGLADAVNLAEQIRVTVAGSPCFCGNAKVFITISLGVHEGDPTLNIDEELKKVDDLLYMAKGRGRNRVCTDLDA